MESKDLDTIETFANEHAGILTVWTRGMDGEEERKKFLELLMHSRTQFDRLRTILTGLYREAAGRERDMSNPNWTHIMAREEGYKKALLDIYNLLPRTKE